MEPVYLACFSTLLWSATGDPYATRIVMSPFPTPVLSVWEEMEAGGVAALRRAIDMCNREGVLVRVVTDQSDGRIAFFTPDKFVNLNIGHRYWLRPVSQQRHMCRTRWFSTSSLDHIVRHEIAHCLLLDRVGREQFDKLYCSKVELDEKLAGMVSKYAVTNPVEFAAEVYVGLGEGKQYPAEVISYYNGLWVKPQPVYQQPVVVQQGVKSLW